MPTVEQLQAKLEAEKAARLKAEGERDNFKTKADQATANFAEQEKKIRRQKIDSFIDQGIKDGKILPAWKEQGMADFMESLEEEEATFNFSEGKEQTKADWFRDFVASFSEHGLFKKMTKPDGDKADDFAEDAKEAEEMAALV